MGSQVKLHTHTLIDHLFLAPFCKEQTTAHKVANVVFHLLLLPLGAIRLIYYVGRKLFQACSPSIQPPQQAVALAKQSSQRIEQQPSISFPPRSSTPSLPAERSETPPHLSLTLNLELPFYWKCQRTCLQSIPFSSPLEKLDISWCDRNITGEDIAIALRKCQNLKELNAQETNTTREGLEALPPSLEKLDIGHCRLTGADITMIIKKCQNLKEFGAWATPITREGLQALPPSLEKLDIGSCRREIIGSNITAADITTVIRKCKNLKDLSAHGTSINKDGLEAVPSSLEKLHIGSCRQFTAADITAVIRKCQNLKEFGASSTSITREGLEALPPSLEKLEIEHCRQLTGADIIAVVERCENLKELFVSYVGGIGLTKEEVLKIRMMNPQLRNFHACPSGIFRI